MATFDNEVWKSRAYDRHEKAIAAGKRKKVANDALLLELKQVDALRVVVEWCTARSLTVTFTKYSGGIYYTEHKEIKVSGRASPRQQMYLLLHECGHHLIGNDKDLHERYGMGYGNEDPKVAKTIHHRLDILEEEFEAWHRGWKLGLRLKVLKSLDKVNFDKTRVRMLRSYCEWAIKMPGYENLDNPASAEETLLGNSHEE